MKDDVTMAGHMHMHRMILNDIHTIYPVKIHTVVFCLFWCGCIIRSKWIRLIDILTSFRVAWMVLWQLYNCPSVNDLTLKDIGKINLGPWFNMRKLSSQYRNSYYEDKTISWLSHIYNRNPYINKMSLYWIRAQCLATTKCKLFGYIKKSIHTFLKL